MADLNISEISVAEECEVSESIDIRRDRIRAEKRTKSKRVSKIRHITKSHDGRTDVDIWEHPSPANNAKSLSAPSLPSGPDNQPTQEIDDEA